jgi:spermidine synthase
MFAVGCRLHSDRAQKGASSVGRVYLLEAMGAGGGGAFYTFFFVPFFTSFQVAFFLGTVNLVSALLLISREEEKGTGKNKILTGSLWGILLVNILLLILPGARVLEENSTARQWRGLQVLDSRWSPYGNVTVGRREEQLTFFANGMPICNAPVPDIALVEEMVHYPLLSIPSPRRVLIIGGGFGGVIREVLKHPVDEVHYTEIDPLIIRMIKENLTPLTRPEIENPRLRIHNLDGRLFIKTISEKFDGIIFNLPSPSSLELNRYYTVEFFNEISKSLSREGVLSISIPGSETYLSPELRDLNLCLLRSLQEVFPSVHVIPGDINYFLASPSKDSGPLLPELFIGRLRERGFGTHFLTEFQIRLKLESQRLNWLEGSLRRGETVKLNRDANPSGLYYGISYWNAQFHPFVQTLWGRLKGLHLWHLALLLALLTCGALALRRKSEEEGAKRVLICLVATSGFFGIAFSVLLIFSFQTLYGYAYHWIGLLVAAFMTGLALGSWMMTRSLEKIQRFFLTIVGVEILMVLFATMGILLLALLYSPAWGQELLSGMRSAFLLLSGLAGYLVGLEFPLSSVIFSGRGGGVSRTAGILYASDLFGAWAGSLLVGVLFIPVLGILRTCAVILFLKLASLSLILILQRQGAKPEKKRPDDTTTAR